jgi:hypothetical protein
MEYNFKNELSLKTKSNIENMYEKTIEEYL